MYLAVLTGEASNYFQWLSKYVKEKSSRNSRKSITHSLSQNLSKYVFFHGLFPDIGLDLIKAKRGVAQMDTTLKVFVTMRFLFTDFVLRI